MIELTQSLARRNRPALSDGRTALLGGELATRVGAAAGRLAAAKPRVLGIFLDNGIDWIVADLAASLAGIPVVPLPLFFSPAQSKAAVDAAGIDTLVAADRSVASALGFSRFVCEFGDNSLLLTREGAVAQPLPSGTAKITFTSGTTGQPKGVCLSAAQQLAVARTLVDATGQVSIERHLCLLPLPVLLENIAGVYAPLLAGAQVIAPPLTEVGMLGATRIYVAAFLRAISRHQPHSVILLPQMLKAWVTALERGAAGSNSLRFVSVGGGKIAPELIARARRAGLPVFEGYGLSECASVVALNTPQNDRIGSVGRVLPHVNVRIAADGEAIVCGNTYLGYLGELLSAPKEVPTGDLGRLDEDGYLRIEGRKKNVIVTSFGRNVSPEWPESALAAQPAIAQAVVFGEALPSCVAVLVPRAPDSSGEVIDAAVAVANRDLPDYARVAAWVRAAEPFTVANGLATANGRPRRNAIWGRYGAAVSASSRQLEDRQWASMLD